MNTNSQSSHSAKHPPSGGLEGLRGIRNNNPLNIKKTQNKWQGEVRSSDKVFVKFSDRFYGYRAAFIILLNYSKRGINTIFSITNTWAPKEDGNNTVKYSQFLTTSTGYPLFMPISFFDKKTMVNLVWAMAQMESGIVEEKALLNSVYDKVIAEKFNQ